MLPGESTWDVPGFDVGRLLGFGPLGEVWQGVEQRSGKQVVLRRLSGYPAEAVAVAIAQLPALGGDHVVGLLGACEVDDDVVLVLQHLPGGSLAGRRGQLSAGQVVTALAPIAHVLGQAHAAGLVHGRISEKEVLLTASGMPVLDGLGITRLRASGSPEQDVRDLCAVGLALLGANGDAVRAVLDAARDAAALAAGLLAACRAEPLAGAPAAPASPVRPPAGRGSARPLVVLIAVLLAAAVVVSRRGASPATDWQQVLQGLDARRTTAFASGDAALLAGVYVSGSPALRDDVSRLAALTTRSQRAHGLRHRVTSLRVVEQRTDRVRLEVVEALAGYLLRGPGVQQVAVAAAPPTRQRVLLERTPLGWQIAQVARAGG